MAITSRTSDAFAGKFPVRGVASTLVLSLIAGTTAAQSGFSALPGTQSTETAQPETIRDPMGGATPSLDDKVRVNEHMIVDLHVQDEDLASVLQMLSIQTQRNILTSRNVSATVTANLYGVTFHEALDAILAVNGYAYVERGNFIYVYTLQEIIEIERATRQRVFKVIKLSYLNGVDAAEFAKSLLSEGGQIKTNGKPADFSIPDNAPVGGEDFALDSTLVVFDFEENVEQIEMLLVQLDTKPVQVLVEATILQTALNEANAFGVDFTILGSLDFVDFIGLGGPLESVNALIGGKGGRLEGGSTTDVAVPRAGESASAISSTPGNTGGPATLKLGIVDGDVAAFLRVLDEVTDTTILSRPNLLTLNRQPARVLVGRKVGYLSTTSTDTATTQTVQFLDTGTQLYVRPFVSADGMIRMELKPQVSEAVIRNATDATGAAVTIPDEITNELVANVLVRDGQTIVLGGLFRESTQASRRQVPFVGDLPIIGALFRGHEDTTQRNEIIFMITPTIVNDRMLVEQGEKATQYMGHIRAGAREGLLPFSREKQSSQLLVKAQRHADRGETESALYYVQRSLSLNPSQGDAIALRERLMTRPTVWPSRRLMDDILSNVSRDALRTMESDLARTKPPAPVFGKGIEDVADFEGDEPSDPSSPTMVFIEPEPDEFAQVEHPSDPSPTVVVVDPIEKNDGEIVNDVVKPAPQASSPEQSKPVVQSPVAVQPPAKELVVDAPAKDVAIAAPVKEEAAPAPVVSPEPAPSVQAAKPDPAPVTQTPASGDPVHVGQEARAPSESGRGQASTPSEAPTQADSANAPSFEKPQDVVAALPESIFALVQESPDAPAAQPSRPALAASAPASSAMSPRRDEAITAHTTPATLSEEFDAAAKSALLRFSMNFGLKGLGGTSDDPSGRRPSRTSSDSL